jgi:hypothetical protein
MSVLSSYTEIILTKQKGIPYFSAEAVEINQSSLKGQSHQVDIFLKLKLCAL